MAPDGKRRLTDCLDNDGVIFLAKKFPGKKANRFIEWFTYSDETLDGKSKSKAYALFDSSLFDTIEVGTVKHIFFIAETRGTMDSLHLRPIEQAKISCAKKLFNELSTTGVKYHNVDSYKSLLDVMQTL